MKFTYYSNDKSGVAVYSKPRNGFSLAFIQFPSGHWRDYGIDKKDLGQMKRISEKKARKKFPKMFAAIEKN